MADSTRINEILSNMIVGGLSKPADWHNLIGPKDWDPIIGGTKGCAITGLSCMRSAMLWA